MLNYETLSIEKNMTSGEVANHQVARLCAVWGSSEPSGCSFWGIRDTELSLKTDS